MKEIKKIFGKKKLHSPSPTPSLALSSASTSNTYTVMATDSLKRLSASELHKIIYRYSHDTAILNSALESEGKAVEELRTRAEDLESQLDFFKKSNLILNAELVTLKSQKEHHTGISGELMIQIEGMKSTLREKEAFISSYKRQLSILNLQLTGTSKKGHEHSEKILENDLNVLSLKIERLLETSSEYQAKLKEQHERAIQFNSEKEYLKIELEKLKLRESSLEITIINLEETVKQSATLANRKGKKIHKKNTKIEVLKSELSTLREEQLSKDNTHEQELLQHDLNQQELLKAQNDLTVENNLLLSRLEKSRKNNDALSQKLMVLHTKLEASNKEFFALSQQMSSQEPPPTAECIHSDSNSNQSEFLVLKHSLERLYKQFMLEFSKSSDGNVSLYSLESPQFSHIERGLNNLIMQLHEKLDRTETKKQPKRQTDRKHRLSQIATSTIFRYLSPRGSGPKKRSHNSQHEIESITG